MIGFVNVAFGVGRVVGVCGSQCGRFAGRIRMGMSTAPSPARAEFPMVAEDVDREGARRELRGRFPEVGEGGMEVGGTVLTVEDLEWFLRDRRYNVADAEKKLRKWLDWRRTLGPLRLEDVEDEIRSGKSEVHEKLDRHRRPVLVVTVRKHKIGEFPVESSHKLVAYQLDECLRRLPSETETVLALIDLRGFSLSNADLTFAKYLVDVFFVYYPRRLSELLLVDAPPLFRPTWLVIKPLLGKYAKLVRFSSSTEVPEYFDPVSDTPKQFL